MDKKHPVHHGKPAVAYTKGGFWVTSSSPISFIKNEGFKPLNTHTVYSVDGTHGFMADTLLQYCVEVGDSAFGLADWGEGSSLQAGRLESLFQL